MIDHRAATRPSGAASRLWRLASSAASAVILSVLLASCSSPPKGDIVGSVPDDYHLVHPISYAEGLETMDIPVGVDMARLPGPMQSTVVGFGQRFIIVEHAREGDFQFLAQVVFGDCPSRIGEMGGAMLHRAGHAEDQARDGFLETEIVNIGARRIDQIGMRFRGIFALAVERHAHRIHIRQRKAHIGSADIGNEAHAHALVPLHQNVAARSGPSDPAQ